MASSVASSSSSSSSSISKSKCKYYVYSKCTRGDECRFQHINCKYAEKCKLKTCTYGHPPKITKSFLHNQQKMPIVIQSQSVSKIEKEVVITESKQMSPSPSSNDLTKGSVEAYKPVKNRHRNTPNEKTACVTPLSEADAETREKNDFSKKKAQLMESLQKQVLDLSRATNILPRNSVSPKEAEAQNKQEPTTAEAATSTSTSTSTSASTITYWKKGTGYGFDSQTDSWNEYMASQQNKTTAILSALNEIVAILTQRDADADMYCVLEQSCVLPVLSHFLKNDSITDIQQQATLYTSIFSFIDILTKPSTIQLFNITLNDSHTLFHHLESLHSRALMTHKFEKLGSHVDADDAETDQDNSILSQIVNMMTKVEEARNKLPKISEGDSNSSSSLVESSSIPLSKDESIASIAQDTKKETAAGPSVSDYVKIMSELRMGQIEKFVSHCYYNESDSNSYRRPWIKRLATEYTDLAQSLPITVDSSVFLRVHESSMAYAQMLIIAPDNTPYGRGCFLFDVAFPSTYPNAPPHVNLQTTGHGSVRFNPNLYECGKVCQPPRPLPRPRPPEL